MATPKFAGVSYYESYEKQANETKTTISLFVEKRMPNFIRHFEQILEFTNTGFLVGDKITYADLTLFQILRATEKSLPDGWLKMETNGSSLVQFKNRIENRHRIKEYLKSDRARKMWNNRMM